MIGGMKVRLQLYTVPGQVFYNATRKLVLKGVDGIVFVADSQEAALDANIESLGNLQENLAELGLTLDQVPVRPPVQQARHPQHRARRDAERGAQPAGRAPLRGGRAARHRRLRDAEGDLQAGDRPDPQEDRGRDAAASRAAAGLAAAARAGAALPRSPRPPRRRRRPPRAKARPAAPPAPVADRTRCCRSWATRRPRSSSPSRTRARCRCAPVETRGEVDIHDQLEKLRDDRGRADAARPPRRLRRLKDLEKRLANMLVPDSGAHQEVKRKAGARDPREAPEGRVRRARSSSCFDGEGAEELRRARR